MPEILSIIFYAAFSGITVFFGGLLSYFFWKKFSNNRRTEEITHFVIAFGGGIILAALALVLIPKGIEELELGPLILSFAAGALIFFYLDKKIEQSGSRYYDFCQRRNIIFNFSGYCPKCYIEKNLVTGTWRKPWFFNRNNWRKTYSLIKLIVCTCQLIFASYSCVNLRNNTA